MRAYILLRPLGLTALGLGIGIVAGASCVDVSYPQVAFQCNPRQSENCPEGFFCCSDDPATADGRLPNYQGRGISNSATPLFSGANNNLGTSGMCVRTDDLAGQGLMELAALNCPIPCNPTWTSQEVAAVCGSETSVCCQTVELEPSDCIQDPDTGMWRAVTGADIFAGRSAWKPGEHATHQDAGGTGCREYAGGDTQSAAFRNCVENLTVADQRGFCLNNVACPTADPSYVDACEALNNGGAPAGSAGETGA